MAIVISSVAKKGADTNYFLEVTFACLLWNVFYVRGSNPTLAIKPVSIPAMMVVFLFGTLELTQTPGRFYSYTDARTTAFVQGVFGLARKEIGTLQPPDDRFLNLHSPTATYSLQCQSYVNDPFTYWQLWNRGVLDPGPLLGAIQNKYFSVIMFSNSDSPIGVITPLKDSGPESPARRVLDTIRRNYQFAKKGVYLYFVPRQQNPS
jgi:hypothetical protein